MSRRDYHLRQYEEPYSSTSSFIDFAEEYCESDASVLVIGCGGGANVHWVTEAFDNWTVTGIDIDDELLDIAREQNENATFEHLSVSDITEEFGEDSFDYTIALQFISFVDIALSDFLEVCCEVSTEGVFFTSLFSEGWIEQETTATNLDDGWEGTYKVYSLLRLKEIVADITPDAEVQYEKFEIDIDLPKPEEPEFKTYTETLADGRRLQISGYMLMPWYNVCIDLPE